MPGRCTRKLHRTSENSRAVGGRGMPETVIIPIELYQQLLDYLKDRTILSNQAKELVKQLEQSREAK
ncbi:hypothetical protein LBWT_38600 [Leptolyngbya boryana IAM M-101]|nr:hypothetical protein LBWT_38600 [Leptolyngbya boryana IAM M-101]BAS64243.1 hypothetical protein LBDG_38600 [Leptolyngbya boryana dg5]